jgi:hypothetical protein
MALQLDKNNKGLDETIHALVQWRNERKQIRNVKNQEIRWYVC